MPVTQFTDAVEIEGSQDITQLTVQGHSTQTEALQTWQDSAETVQAQFTGDGRLQIGSFDDGMMATDDALIEAHRHESATTKPKRGLHLLGEVSGVLDSLVSWVVQELVLKGTGGISALHTALRIRLTNENTGTMDSGAALRAADVELINNGGSSNSVPEVTGLRVGVTHQTDGYADTAYGVKVEMQADAPEQVGVQYAFHANAGIAHFGEELEVPVMTSDPGDSAPTDTVKVYVKDDAGTPKLYSKDDQGTVRELGGGGGEVNTASNVGTAGVGLFNQKTGEDLEFKRLNAGSNRMSITDDTVNSKVDVDVVEANLSLGNLGGTLGIGKGGTGQTTKAAAFNALSPGTSKGDLIVHDGSTSVCIVNLLQ